MGGQEVVTVDAWHQLLNAGDIEGLLALIHPDVEVGGPRGASRGLQVFREWFGRAGVGLTPVRYFHKGAVVVAEEDGLWQAPGGEAIGSQTVWSLFSVEDCLITRIYRFDSLAGALRAAGMDEADEVPGVVGR
jgi:SnoaL-like protein